MQRTIKIIILFLFPVITFSQEISESEWLEDLEYYRSGLEQNHIDVYNKISKTDFVAHLSGIKESLPKMSDLETTLELMRLTRKIGDGHTAISTRNRDFHNYPFEVQNFNGDWRVIKAAEEHSNLLGMKLESIDDVTVNVVAEKIGGIAQFVENEHSQIVRTGENMTTGELLYGLHITKVKTQANFTFGNDAGHKKSLLLHAISRQEFDHIPFNRIEPGVSEIQKPDSATYDFLWYAPVEGTDAVYIHFESYPKFEEMMAFGEELVAYIFRNNVRKLIIDLRNNGGGDLYIGLVLANALNLADPVDWKSGVYVLCDKVTFSAATSNTALFRELLNARVVGEPTGSNPTGYQDMDTFELPHSKLVVCYSKRFFRIQREVTPGVQPDVLMQYEWESFSRGKDNMLEWVIKDLKNKNTPIPR